MSKDSFDEIMEHLQIARRIASESGSVWRPITRQLDKATAQVLNLAAQEDYEAKHG